MVAFDAWECLRCNQSCGFDTRDQRPVEAEVEASGGKSRFLQPQQMFLQPGGMILFTLEPFALLAMAGFAFNGFRFDHPLINGRKI